MLTLILEYRLALQELENAKNAYDHIEPTDFKAIDAAIFRITSAENRFSSIHKKINKLGGVAV